MKATTIKVENPLLDELQAIKPTEQSLSAFIRDILDGEIRRVKLIHAADQYTDFLSKHPEEAECLSRWEEAPLGDAPRQKKKKGTP
ncbi:MAG: hypothetical protein HY540_04135 [Deltaproteobacteria bacterium]|nr:hypothetical protein [Deltaproteobacteria bacterium]